MSKLHAYLYGAAVLVIAGLAGTAWFLFDRNGALHEHAANLARDVAAQQETIKQRDALLRDQQFQIRQMQIQHAHVNKQFHKAEQDHVARTRDPDLDFDKLGDILEESTR